MAYLRSVQQVSQCRSSVPVHALVVAITPINAVGVLPSVVRVVAGCSDVAVGGAGHDWREDPHAIAPITPLAVAVDVLAIDVQVPVERPIDRNVSIDVHIPADVSIDVAAYRSTIRGTSRTTVSGVAATADVHPSSASSIRRCLEDCCADQENSDAYQRREHVPHDRPPMTNALKERRVSIGQVKVVIGPSAEIVKGECPF